MDEAGNCLYAVKSSMIQVILGVIIILLGLITFKLVPLDKKVDHLVVASLLVVITLIAKRVAIMVPLFGAESLKIGFEYLPLMIAGFLLGPSYGFMIGLVCDLIGLIITPTGFPFLGFTLGTIMVSWIPGMVRHYIGQINPKKVMVGSFILFVAICAGAILFVQQLDAITISSVVYHVDSTSRMILTAILIVILVALTAMIFYLNKKMNQSDIFPLWLLSVVLVELIVTMAMTPSWLQIMYGIPYWLSACVRIIKLVVVIPLEIIVGYIIVKSVYRIV